MSWYTRDNLPDDRWRSAIRAYEFTFAQRCDSAVVTIKALAERIEGRLAQEKAVTRWLGRELEHCRALCLEVLGLGDCSPGRRRVLAQRLCRLERLLVEAERKERESAAWLSLAPAMLKELRAQHARFWKQVER